MCVCLFVSCFSVWKEGVKEGDEEARAGERGRGRDVGRGVE